MNSGLVRAARADEKQGVLKHNVFTQGPMSECYSQTGGPPVSIKWVDINKGDDSDPDYRSRWVGREFKGNDRNRDDLFAATPPLEYLRFLVSRCASSQLGPRPTKLMVQDVKQAYFYAPATRDVYVDLPEDDMVFDDEGNALCGKLNNSMHGTRDTAQN